MEDRLLQLFPDQIVKLKDYTSFVNQPERIQISSQQDVNDYDPTTLVSYYNFKVVLPRPALNVKSVQLARASIPIATPNIPDTETTFWYYALPQESPGNIYANNGGIPGALLYTFDTSGNIYASPGGALVANSGVYFDSGNLIINTDVNSPFIYSIPAALTLGATAATYGGGTIAYYIQYTAPVLAQRRSNYLRYVRLVATNVQPELMNNFTGGFNRSFDDYDDFTTELIKSTTDDPLNGEPSNEIIGTFKFVENQVTFYFLDSFNKIVFRGLNTTFRYLPCAADDPLWPIAAAQLQVRDRANTRFDFSGIIEIVQPFQLYRTLNLRIGFNYATYPSGDNYVSMIRPIPPFIQALPPGLGNFTIYDQMASGYIDLVYSSCCHIYTDITGGSTVDSIANKALLGVIPLNAANLGVGFHSMPLNNPLTKIATLINEIYIEMRTDSGLPFYIGNNAIVSLELILTY